MGLASIKTGWLFSGRDFNVLDTLVREKSTLLSKVKIMGKKMYNRIWNGRRGINRRKVKSKEVRSFEEGFTGWVNISECGGNWRKHNAFYEYNSWV